MALLDNSRPRSWYRGFGMSGLGTSWTLDLKTSWTSCRWVAQSWSIARLMYFRPRVRAMIVNYKFPQPQALLVTQFCRSLKISRSLFCKIRDAPPPNRPLLCIHDPGLRNILTVSMGPRRSTNWSRTAGDPRAMAGIAGRGRSIARHRSTQSSLAGWHLRLRP